MDTELNNKEKIHSAENNPKRPKPGQVVKPSKQLEDSSKKEKESRKVEEGAIKESAVVSKAVKEDSKEGASESKNKKKDKIKSKKEIESSQKKQKKKLKLSKKSIIIGSVSAVTIIGLSIGGYFLYSSGVLDRYFNGGIKEEQVEEAPNEQKEEPSSPEEDDTVKNLDYLKDQFENTESVISTLQENYRLNRSLNLEDSDF